MGGGDSLARSRQSVLVIVIYLSGVADEAGEYGLSSLIVVKVTSYGELLRGGLFICGGHSVWIYVFLIF